MPDLQDSGTVAKLREWNGEWAALNVLTFVRVRRDGVRQAAVFPPKGSS